MESFPTKMTKKLLEELDKLVEKGWYASRDEAIRDAVRELVKRRKLGRLEDAIERDIEWGL